MDKQYAFLPDDSFGYLNAAQQAQYPFRQAVRRDDLVYLSGQVDVHGHPGDMLGQTRAAMENMTRVLGSLGLGMEDVVQLTPYYVGLDGWRESAAIQAEYFPGGVAVTPVVCSGLVESRWLVEIEAIARPNAVRRFSAGTSPLLRSGGFRQAVRCGNTVYACAQVASNGRGEVVAPGDLIGQTWAALDTLRQTLGELGASLGDVVKTTAYYVGLDRWAESAAIQARALSGAAATHVGVSSLVEPGFLFQIDAVAAVDAPRTLAGPEESPRGVRCGNLVYVAGQSAVGEDGAALHPQDNAAQTRLAMERIKGVLAELGATPDDVLRKNTYYGGLDNWRATVPIRASYFQTGICATGVAVEALPARGARIQMEAVALVGE